MMLQLLQSKAMMIMMVCKSNAVNVMVAPLTDIVTCCSLDRVATDGDYVDLMNNYLTPCVANFALAAGNDGVEIIAYRLCYKNEEPIGRYHTLKTIQNALKMSVRYLIMLPETILSIRIVRRYRYGSGKFSTWIESIVGKIKWW